LVENTANEALCNDLYSGDISLFAWQAARACTGIRLTAKDGAVVVARTLEFGADLQSKVLVYPAGTPVTGSLPNSASGSFVYDEVRHRRANAFGLPMVVDGLNDQGLYVASSSSRVLPDTPT